MSPYEISSPYGSVEHMNEESGSIWLGRLLGRFPRYVWLNPLHEEYWEYTHSIGMIRELVGKRMFPLTLKGVASAIEQLNN